ncbi:ECF-type sigma factor [Myxococcus sp. K38C18041901]|uniref:ECF-type sigma factor n=1 Tax=Myxococcus guangdongensis TaxID=2906760 RepID=UPI0020A73F39|nr:ECF-type sigma factor [Myxococcus guangdongensis]MCP3058895.1 ECF-type sigma factor [Myxococcus guangdongensis]
MSTAELAELLEGAREEDSGARDALMAAACRELQWRLSPEVSEVTPLHPMRLVEEAWARLFAAGVSPESRPRFLCAASRAMRKVLVDRARAPLLLRRAARRERVSLRHLGDEAPAGAEFEVLQLEEALSELESFQPRLARLVELRYFAGLSLSDTAAALEVSQATARRDWAYVRVWLTERLSH